MFMNPLCPRDGAYMGDDYYGVWKCPRCYTEYKKCPNCGEINTEKQGSSWKCLECGHTF